MGLIDGVISLGPWGGQDGNTWSFRASQEITNITIREDERSVVSISFKDASGHISGTFGGNNSSSNSDEVTKIEINSPSEYLKSISGSYGEDDYIRSLTFITNFTTYGPFGICNGDDNTEFTIPITENVVVGFFGRADSHLNALGIYVQPVQPQGSLSLGPWGGPGGDAFSFRMRSSISQITLHEGGNIIKSISFKDANGDEYGVFGGKDPNDIGDKHTVELDHGQSEYLKAITGTYGDYYGFTVITSLSFITNLSTYGPFGETSDGTSFSLPIEGSFVNGFHGRAGYYLDAIGIHCDAIPPPQDHIQAGAISIGPWGGPGGDPWSYITNRGLKKIIIHVDTNIKSISFRDISGISSTTFGGKNPYDTGEPHIVEINWPDDHLISISGTYGDFCGLWTIKMLSFTTNVTTYGPFGIASEDDTCFSIPISNSKIVGFHGAAGYYLDSIGIFVTPVKTLI